MVMIPTSHCPVCHRGRNQFISHAKCQKKIKRQYAEANSPEGLAYFDYRCAACEEQWHARVQDWKFGAPDAELDLLYSIKEPIKH